jgi:monomeric sarcosine oxidase
MGITRADVVIVGGGLAGSAAAWALASRGDADIILLEQFEPGHRRGSSHGSARIFRRAYPDPFYVDLTGQARELWDQLEDEAGERFIDVIGALDFGPGPEPALMHALLGAHDVEAELLHPAEAHERWPGIDFGPDPVLYHPDGGVLNPERAMQAMRSLAEAHGASVRFGARATQVVPDDDGVTVYTADEEIRARVAVVAAGAWMEPLLGGTVTLPELTITQQQAFNFAPVWPGAWPTFIRWDGDVVRYGLPAGEDGEVPGALKVGEHGNGTITTADGRDGVPSNAARERVERFVRARLPGLDPSPCGELTCLYTETGNEDFIIDRRGPVVAVSACSGHGAKFAPLTGTMAADLAIGEPQQHHRFMLRELPGTYLAQSASLLARALSRP